MIKIVWPWFIKVARPDGVRATTFLPFVVIFANKKFANDPIICNHELIHAHQMLECLLIGAMILRLWWGIKGIKRNPFEQEAYANQENLDYLKTRKLYAWVQITHLEK